MRCKIGLRTRPPEPLSDVNHADVHRVYYVGSATKKKYQDIKKDMPAASNAAGVEHGTTKEFRESLVAAVNNSTSCTEENGVSN